jgi:hypothetical protein
MVEQMLRWQRMIKQTCNNGSVLLFCCVNCLKVYNSFDVHLLASTFIVILKTAFPLQWMDNI